MENYSVVIVGAGISGRMAKIMVPDAKLFEAAAEGRHRIAAMVGINYLHEPVPELDPYPITVVTGYDVMGYQDSLMPARALMTSIDGIQMMRYQRKCRGWSTVNETEAESHMQERGGRYQLVKQAWGFNTPAVGVHWNAPVLEVNPREHTLVRMRGGSPAEVKYDVLIWTPPITALYNALGFDSKTLGLLSTPIWYLQRRPLQQSDDKNTIIVQYVPDDSTPIYRRSVYVDGQGSVSESLESIRAIEGFQEFWPGKISASPNIAPIEATLRAHDIILAGRFARWDPDELTHHTAKHLREVLK